MCRKLTHRFSTRSKQGRRVTDASAVDAERYGSMPGPCKVNRMCSHGDECPKAPTATLERFGVARTAYKAGGRVEAQRAAAALRFSQYGDYVA